MALERKPPTSVGGFFVPAQRHGRFPHFLWITLFKTLR